MLFVLMLANMTTCNPCSFVLSDHFVFGAFSMSAVGPGIIELFAVDVEKAKAGDSIEGRLSIRDTMFRFKVVKQTTNDALDPDSCDNDLPYYFAKTYWDSVEAVVCGKFPDHVDQENLEKAKREAAELVGVKSPDEILVFDDPGYGTRFVGANPCYESNSNQPSYFYFVTLITPCRVQLRREAVREEGLAQSRRAAERKRRRRKKTSRKDAKKEWLINGIPSLEITRFAGSSEVAMWPQRERI